MTTVAPDSPTIPFIRTVRRADLLGVLDIERRSFPQPWSIEAFERFLDSPAFLVAVDRNPGSGAGAVIGYVVADAIPNHERPLGHIKDLAVHPNRRKSGIGRQLLERAVSTLRSIGAQSVKLEVRESNGPAIALYRNSGFVHRRTIPRYYDDGENAMVMLRTWG